MSKEQASENDFEKTIAELEQIVKDMEQGDLPLQTALEKFERGVQLTKQGQATLDAAEQKVQILMSQSGNAELRDLDTNNE
ncbi:exodeoxyribonuclease VII small subunit [Alteromonas facilis]|uniref:exodeoxyribonuclease VII small subunit n=1 Tax=Alteromonas facilis TaxID=2048004 RepID=UPI000C28CCE7|nr:exodeoxyribonuclease VII small subunit [Alteromonas facilis]